MCRNSFNWKTYEKLKKKTFQYLTKLKFLLNNPMFCGHKHQNKDSVKIREKFALTQKIEYYFKYM